MLRCWGCDVGVEGELGRHAASVAASVRGFRRTSVVGGGSEAERLRVESRVAMSVRRLGSVMRSDSTILREAVQRMRPVKVMLVNELGAEGGRLII